MDKKKTEIQQQYIKKTYFPKINFNENSLFSSRYFGDCWLKDNERWPILGGHVALFVLQLDIKTLPLEYKNILGDSGLLQFFIRPEKCKHGNPDHYLIRRVFPEKESGSFHKQPETCYVINDKEPKSKDIELWLDCDDYSYIKHTDTNKEYINKNPYQGDKLGGFPFFYKKYKIPKDSLGDEMIFLYQLDMGTPLNGISLAIHAPGLISGQGTAHLFVSKNNLDEYYFNWSN